MRDAVGIHGRVLFASDSPTLARFLIGQRLVRVLDDGTRLAGTIVETEAYCGCADLAAHSKNGHLSPRNESMFGRAGTAYVYFTYGMHHCFNVVCGVGAHGDGTDDPVAVLIRALHPIEGLERMRKHRSAKRTPGALVTDHELCSGPARLCEALAIDRSLDGVDMRTSNKLFIERVTSKALPTGRLVNTPRVGVAYAGVWASRPLRWYLKDCPHVSRGRPSA